MPRDNGDFARATAAQTVDAINAEFYGRFQYPWAPMSFDYLTDPDFETVMLNQSIGYWKQDGVPREPNIWVAGCGTNQAVYTALRFPRARVVGSDLSAQSLRTAATTAKYLGLSNLELRRESINETGYREEFDYVICTGVIHHNARPAQPLLKLARAVRPDGILELMVYNRYHRVLTQAFQKAMRLFDGGDGRDFEGQLRLARQVISGFRAKSLMAPFLKNLESGPESQLADSLLQPVEHSYTVSSLERLAASCGLEYAAHCISRFDTAAGAVNWNMEFNDRDLQRTYDALPDARRWQVSNYLMLEASPMLWFYMRRSDSPRPRKTERQLAAEFLDLSFKRAEAGKKVFMKTADGGYSLSPHVTPHPGAHRDPLCQKIIDLVDARGARSMRQILETLGVGAEFSLAHRLRVLLTTNAFPFLIAT
jgi:SAM-dependent methyltransferase